MLIVSIRTGARALAAFALIAGGWASSAQAQKLCFTCSLDAAQEVPPTPSSGVGVGYLVMDRAANTLTYTFQISGLTSAETLAHIHGFSGPGVNSGIKHNLPLGANKTGVWNYLESDEPSIIAGLTYANIHTANFGGGEIRGQILRDDSQALLIAKIDDAQEVPPTGTGATGLAYFKVNTVTNTVDYYIHFIGLSSAETLAHIHGFSPPGVNSGIKVNLALGNPKIGSFTYIEPDEAGYLGGLAYVNIHTANFGGGEIRGQMLLTCTNPSTYCTAKMNSLGCLPAIGSTGTPSATAGSGFTVRGTNVRNNKPGLLFYGVNGGQAVPFTGGTLCIATPIKRTPGVNSGGTPAPANDCTGVYAFDMNCFAVGSCGGSPLAALTVAGTVVCCQYWGRDPGFAAPNNTTLTDALEYAIGP
jgi:CHRD domain-containing protein